MKLNLELEIDWIDEDMSIDDVVKEEIINSITNKIQKKIESEVHDKVNKSINETTIAKIDSMVESLFNEFMNKPVTINDDYGDIIEQYDNVFAVIKKKFDGFMEQKVDKNGRSDNSRYGKYTRLEYIIDNQLRDFAEKFTTDAVKKVSEEIKLHVQNGLTTKLGKELMTVLKVNEMIGLPKAS